MTTEQRLEDLKRKLAARKKSPAAYRDNIPALEAEIARLEALQKGSGE